MHYVSVTLCLLAALGRINASTVLLKISQEAAKKPPETNHENMPTVPPTSPKGQPILT